MKTVSWCRAIIALALIHAIGSAQTGPAFDVIIRDGRIVDGTGAPWYYGDVGIRDGKIAAIGKLDGTATRTIDARGLVVAPGFIDMLGQSEFHLLVDNRAASKILQGVTTEITGEGSSIAPLSDQMIRAGGVRNGKTPFEAFGVIPDWRTLDEYFKRLEERTHPALNIGTFVGAGGVRDYVIGREDRPATPAELDRMKSLVAQAMEQGALGLSSSLQYVPDRFATTDELVELAKVAARYGGIYITHQRSEGDRISESLEEIFTIAERAQIAAEIFHLKTSNKANWGTMPAVLKKMEAARARGLDITANQYPYIASSNPLEASLPVWVREGGFEKMLARLKDPAQRERIRNDMLIRGPLGKISITAPGVGRAFWSSPSLTPSFANTKVLLLPKLASSLGKIPAMSRWTSSQRIAA